MPRTRLSSKGQVVIPKSVRDRMGLRPGDELEVTLHEDHLHLRKRPSDALAAFTSTPAGPFAKGDVEALLDDRFA